MFNKDSSRTLSYIAGFVLTCGSEWFVCVWRRRGWIEVCTLGGRQFDNVTNEKKWRDVWNLPGRRADSLLVSHIRYTDSEVKVMTPLNMTHTPSLGGVWLLLRLRGAAAFAPRMTSRRLVLSEWLSRIYSAFRCFRECKCSIAHTHDGCDVD